MSAPYKLLPAQTGIVPGGDPMKAGGPTDKNMDNSVGDIRQMIFDTLRSSVQKLVELSDQTNIVNDLGLDSVAVMDFVMEIEDRFDISVPLDKIAEIETLGDLVFTVRDLKANA
ncbi:MAG TPA: phosphopantetheine-binding protein [Aliidongia sp.]|nr:phosphopantetheine-binding protein [Aliidongia sp.]